MTRDKSIEERCVASDFDRVGREAEAEAKGLKAASAALEVLTGGLSAEARQEVFDGIRRQLGEAGTQSQTDMAILGELFGAKDIVAAHQASAARMAVSAHGTARQVEERGLPR